MKQLTILILLFYGTICFAQSAEFETSQNGLIYSNVTVSQLKNIVDSLNLKFKVCELNKKYLAKSQAKAHYIVLENSKVKQAKTDIEANISFNDFVKKYKKARVEKELLVLKYNYVNYKNKNTINFKSIELTNELEHQFHFDTLIEKYQGPLNGKWVFEYNEKSNYSPESISAFYFIENFTNVTIPEKYARMIQYSDCLVDTSSEVFYKKALERVENYDEDRPMKVNEFINYIHHATNYPEYNEDYSDSAYIKHLQLFNTWQSNLFLRVDSLKRSDINFSTLFNEAILEAKENGNSDNEFEDYVAHYISKKTALELKRNRVVSGGCSADQGPRIHAYNIAILSAETVNWEIFLRSHLDIMNDNFSRASDGSYAWGARKTYIKELEVLDINVLDLLLGISLRIENPSDNHYYGSISRVGRALSESKQANEIEAKMLEMIADRELDVYNRVLIYYLFLNYNHNLNDEDKKNYNQEKLKLALNTLPAYLTAKAMTHE